MTSRSLALLPRYLAPSAWWEHVPVAHWLVERLQPKAIVELGSHYGVSFFAFCEAAEAFSPETFVYAVDSWEGDEQAGIYGDQVYNQVAREQEARHRSRSRQVRSSFDEAAAHFSASSIDLLHIDGLHTYDAVKHDVETWRSLVQPEGVILFHDINVRENDFGVWRLWDELTSQPGSHGISLSNGHGLGILCLSSQAPSWFSELIELQPLLQAKGSLLAQISQLRPECEWNELDHRPYKLQLREAQQAIEQIRREHDDACAHLQALHKAQLHALDQNINTVSQENAFLQNSILQMQTELLEMRTSSSWKLTAPFRQAARLFGPSKPDQRSQGL